MNYLHKYTVPNFLKHKNNIINLIKKLPINPYKDKAQSISHTDWNTTKSTKREYLDYVINNVFPDFALYCCQKFNINKLEIKNVWFQFYKQNDFHKPHLHGGCHFSSVFYINLPGKLKTKIYDLDNNVINFDVSEGDIISFPSFLKHESLTNLSNKDKIVISFNSDLIL